MRCGRGMNGIGYAHREDENECALLFEDEVMTQDFGSTVAIFYSGLPIR